MYCNISILKQNISRTIDIKDAYYSVPIYEDDRKYLKFIFDEILLQYIIIYRKLPLKLLSFRVITLLCLLSGQRDQAFTSIDVRKYAITR